MIGALERERRERIREAGSEGVVERGELGEQEAHRPAVGGEVVEDEEESVIVRGQRDQINAKERAFGEVEAAERAILGEGLQGGEAIGSDRRGGEHVKLDFEGNRRVDPSLRGAVDGGKRRPQGLVAEDDRLERTRERGAVEGAVNAEERGDVGRGVAGGELLGEPEALLGERERERPVAGRAEDRRARITRRIRGRRRRARRGLRDPSARAGAPCRSAATMEGTAIDAAPAIARVDSPVSKLWQARWTATSELEEQAPLGIEERGLAREEAEVLGVEEIDPRESAASLDVARIGEVRGRHAGREELLVGERGDAALAAAEQIPERIDRGRPGEATGEADDGDRVLARGQRRPGHRKPGVTPRSR